MELSLQLNDVGFKWGNQNSDINISKKEPMFRANLKKKKKHIFFLVGFLPENCHSVAPLQQSQRHKAILNLLQNHQMHFFFLSRKASHRVGPSCPAGEFINSNNKKEINIEFESKLLAVWKM